MRPYTLVGELLLSDGTTYTRLATYEAVDMEMAQGADRWPSRRDGARHRRGAGRRGPCRVGALVRWCAR